MAATTYPTTILPTQRPVTAALYDYSQEVSSFQRLGFIFLLVFLFLAFSRVFDVKFAFLHITGLSYRAVFAMVLFSRGFATALNTRIGRAMLAFTVCFGMSVPFSLWKGGSLPTFRDGWLLFSFVAFLATGGLIANYAQTRKAINVLAWAFFVFVLIANVFGSTATGRLFLEQGKFANPNEMAQALLIGMPLWGARLANSRAGLSKGLCAGVMILMLFTVFRTGSRGAMIAFTVMLIFLFTRASIMGKTKMVLATILLGGAIMATMPGKLISRYKTIAEDEIIDDEMDAAMRDSALGSSASRKLLLKNSIKFTIRHPLFGVGPGMFPVADNDEAIANGLRKGQWLGTHNSYTQVSSELGIPALIFFVAAIVMSFRGPYQVYKKTRGDPRTADIGAVALGLHYAMLIYIVTIFFEHIAYTVMLPVFAGLASSLIRTSNQEIARRLASPYVEPLTSPVFRTYSPTERTRTA